MVLRKTGAWKWRRRRPQRQLWDVEKFTDVPQEVQSSIKEYLQQQQQEVEQKRNDLLPEHQILQKRSQKIESIHDQNRNMQKETVAAAEDQTG